MRAFFALAIDADTALAIERWQQLCWPALPSPVPAANYHITLAFLGDINQATFESLHEKAGAIEVERFTLKLDQLGFWSKPGVLWVGPSEIPKPLEELAQNIKTAAALQGIGASHSQFKPHLTLKRRLRDAPTGPLIDPDFSIDVDEFHLMESMGSKSGVYYESRLCWELG